MRHRRLQLGPGARGLEKDEAPVVEATDVGKQLGGLWACSAAHASGTLTEVESLDPVLVQTPIKCMVCMLTLPSVCMLTLLLTLPSGNVNPTQAWSPHDAARVLSVDDEALTTWAVDHGGGLSSCGRTSSSAELAHKLAGGVWDPHASGAAATWAGAAVAVWDLRTHAAAGGVSCAASLSPDHCVAWQESEGWEHVQRA
jgi:hypothetical protein